MRLALTAGSVAGTLLASLAAAAPPTKEPAARPAPPASPGVPAPATATLTISPRAVDMDAMRRMKLMYFPTRLETTPDRPAQVKKEPAYRGKARYVTVRIGNGPASLYVAALDEPEGDDARIYLDANRNGDLTDDGDGAWAGKQTSNGIASYGPNVYVLRGSWGTEAKETSTAPYGVSLSRTPARDMLIAVRTSARVGRITLAGQPYQVMLFENDSDGLFNKKFDGSDEAPEGGLKTKPVTLFLDPIEPGMPEGNPQKRVSADIRGSFVIDGVNYLADPSPDGARLTLAPSYRILSAPRPRVRPKLLAAGTPAPDFMVETLEGKPVKLADYKGKVVVLDFWATWCGPCQAAMPYVEKLHQSVKGQEVAVVGVCVWDDRNAYRQWVPENRSKYTFEFLFDPAGQQSASSIATSLYHVTGIPTTYVIDREGKVVAAVLGSRTADQEIEEALRKVGIKLPERQPAKP